MKQKDESRFFFAYITVEPMNILKRLRAVYLPFFLAVFFLSFLPGTVSAVTTSGTLTDDEIWSGEILLTGDVTVPSGVTLTVEPSTTIRAQALSDDQAGGTDTSRVELIVKGTLSAVGTDTEPIVFTSTSISPAKSDWYGVRVITEKKDETLTLAYCIVEYSKIGISVGVDTYNQTIDISNSTIQHISGDGISIIGKNGSRITATISSNSISGNEGAGIYATSSGSNSEVTGSISDNSITGSNGIHLYAASLCMMNLPVTGNTISSSNYSLGIYLETYNNAIESSFIVRGNTISSNCFGCLGDEMFWSFGIYGSLHQSIYCEITDNDIYQNWLAGIYIQGAPVILSSAVIDSNNIHDNPYGLVVEGVDVTIRNNSVYKNAMDGILLFGNSSTNASILTLNSIYENGGRGFSCETNSASVEILYNDIHDNGENGIDFFAANGSLIEYNNLIGNGSQYTVYYSGTTPLNARSNYWGTTVTQEMDSGGNPKNISKIYDKYDNGNIGEVDYHGWLYAPVILPVVPVSHITYPDDASTLYDSELHIQGISVSPNGVSRVEISLDGGITWLEATGAESWFYDWTVSGNGTYTLLSRVIDKKENIEIPGTGISVTVSVLPPPNAPTISPVTTPTATTPQQISGTKDSDSSVWLNNTLIVPADSNTSWVYELPLTEGKNDFALLAKNEGGKSSAEFLFSIILDQTPPQLSATAPADGRYLGAAPENISFTYTDAATEIDDTATTATILDSLSQPVAGTWETTDNTVTFTPQSSFPDDTYTASVTVHDLVGNSTDSSISFTVDKGAADRIKRYIWVANAGSNTVSKIDTESDSVAATINVGSYPQAVAVSNKYVFVANRDAKSISIINSDTDTVEAAIELDRHPVALSLGADKFLYAIVSDNTIGNTPSNMAYLYRINVQTSSVENLLSLRTITDLEIGIGVNYNNIAYIPFSYTWSSETGIIIVDLNTFAKKGEFRHSRTSGYIGAGIAIDDNGDGWVATMREVGQQNIVRVTPEGNRTYYASGGNNAEVIIDKDGFLWTATHPETLIKFNTTDHSSSKYTLSGWVSGGRELAAGLTYANGYIWFVDKNNDSVRKIDPSSGAEVAVIAVGDYPLSKGDLSGYEALTSGLLDVDDIPPPPDTPTLNPVTTPTAITPQQISGTKDANSSVWLNNTRIVPADASTEWVYDVLLAEGNNEFSLLAKNESGRSSSELLFSIILDRAPPQLVATVPADGVYLNTAPENISFTYTDATTEVDDTATTATIVDSFSQPVAGTWSMADNTATFTPQSTLPDSTFTASVTVYDLAGNSTESSIRFTVDTVAPSVPTLNPLTTPTRVTAQQIGGSKEAGSSVWLNNALIVPVDESTSWAYDVALLAEGANDFSILTEDKAGNRSEEVPFTIILDTVPPSVPTLNSVTTPTAVTPQQISGTKEAGSSVWLNSTLVVPADESTGWTYALPLTEGSNDFSLLAEDKAGNRSTGQVSSIILDLTPPQLAATVPADGVYLNAAPENISFSYTDATTEIDDTATTATIVDSLSQPVSGTWSTSSNTVVFTPQSPFSDKTFNASVTVYDLAGNSTDNSISFTVDTAAPAAPTLDPVITPTTEATQQLTGTKEAGTSVRLNNADIIPLNDEITWTHTFTLVQGENTFTLSCRDQAGNTSETASASIILDTTAPVLSSTTPAHNSFTPIQPTTVEFLFIEEHTALNESATLSSVDIFNAQGTTVRGSWGVRDGERVVFTPELPFIEGQYSLHVTARDLVGNATEANLTFTYDGTPPNAPTVNPVQSPTSFIQQELTGSKDADASLRMNGVEIFPPGSGTEDIFPVYNLYGSAVSGHFSTISESEKDTFEQSGEWKDYGARTWYAHKTDVQDSVPVYRFFREGHGHFFTASESEKASYEADPDWQFEGIGFYAYTYNRSGTLPVYRFYSSLHTDQCFTIVESFLVESSSCASGKALKNYPSHCYEGIGWYAYPSLPQPPYTATTWSHTVTLEEGENTFTFDSLDRAGNTSPEVSVTVQYDETAPLPVGNLTVNGEGSGREALLDWTGYPEAMQVDVAFYRVYVRNSLFTQVGGLEAVADVPAGTFTYRVSEGLEPGKTYFFAVVAVDNKGNSNDSVTPVSSEITDVEPPEPARNLRANNNQADLSFIWDHSLNSAGDLAAYVLTFNSEEPLSIEPGTNTFTRTGLAPASGYPCSVAAKDHAGNLSEAREITGVTQMPNPGNLILTGHSGYVSLSWDTVQPEEWVDHYAVYVADQPFTSVEGLTPRLISESGTANVTSLNNGTTYSFAVTTVNISGGSSKAVVSQEAGPIADTTGPEITAVTAAGLPLADGAVFTESTEIAVTATDAAAVSRVEFLVNGIQEGTDTQPDPAYTWIWNIRQQPDGEHTLTVRAYDSLGNMSGQSFQVTLQLALPDAPQLTAPAPGLLTNEVQLTVQGTAEPESSITVLDNGTPAASGVIADDQGKFSAEIALQEGENRLTANAGNRAGTGPDSAEILVTLDTSLPAAPNNLTAEARAGGQLKLDWRAPQGEPVGGYLVFRAATQFSDPAAAEQITPDPIAASSYTDLTPSDATWFYAVLAADTAGNRGLLSETVSAESDRVGPRVLSVSVTRAEGQEAAEGTAFAPGLLHITLTLSEPLGVTPFVSVVPEGGSPYALQMEELDELRWKASYTVTENTPSGTASLLFSGRDRAGNRGTEIDSGQTLVLDTDGPAVTALRISPAAPIQYDTQPEITVQLGLNEAVKAGTLPGLSYRLSGESRELTPVAGLSRISTQSGETETWQAVFTLPEDAGLAAAETLRFFFEAQDDLGNTSTAIQADNQFQVYQGDLPPLAVPLGLTAQAEAGGKVALSWEPVEGAIAYQLFRRHQDAAEFTDLQRLDTLEYLDEPEQEATWFYAVASIRKVGEEESLSGLSDPVSVRTDRTLPEAPTNLTLELVPQGIRLQWDPPAGAEAVSYALYRSADAEITSVEGMTPLAEDIQQTDVVDPAPSATEHAYAVTAVDAVGNQSLPSNSAYANFTLLPVSTFKVVQNGTDQPVISWTHAHHGDLAGYQVYVVHQDDSRTALGGSDEQPIQALSLTDTGYTGGERLYSVNALDTNGFASLNREIFLPALRADLLPESVLRRGLMNTVQYRVRNLGQTQVTDARLTLTVGGKNHLSDPFDLAGGEHALVPVTIGGYENLADYEEIKAVLSLNPHQGEQVRIIRTGYIDVLDGMHVLQFGNEEFLRGGTGKVWFHLENSGDQEIELITATQDGNSSSTTVRYQLLDEDGNVLVTAPFKQAGGSNLVSLSNHNVIARIPAGGSFSSEPTLISIPSGVPDQLKVRLVIDKVSYHQTREDQVVMQGLSGEFPVSLVDTTYFGEISSIEPAVSNGDQDIIIIGQAVERESEEALADVPLNLVITVSGFERKVEVNTGADGSFTYAFTPNQGESGRYQVRAVHPDLLDKPVHGEFVITRVAVRPATVNLSIPRNYEQQFSFTVETGIGTELSNLELLYREEDQTGGVYPAGVHLTPGPIKAQVAGKTSTSLTAQLWADNSAPDTGSLKLKVVSDESLPEFWADITVNTSFTDAKPALYFSPSRLETGVVPGDAITENITLKNKGLAALEAVRLSLTDLAENPAPSWLRLNIASELGDIEVGASRDVPITFAPDSGVVAGSYQFQLWVESSNYQKTPIYIFVVINQSGQGNALFKLADIYTGTFDRDGEQILGLQGAKISLQNEATLIKEADRTSDALGEVEYFDLPAGTYKYRITAEKHQEQIGRITVKPGMTATEEVFLDYNLVTVSWEVTEISIEDRYEILLTATYETDVPAPVVIPDPFSVSFTGSNAVYNGEFNLTNHGNIRADDLAFHPPPYDGKCQFDLPDGLPDSLGAGERITVPYRLICDDLPEDDDECYLYNKLGITYKWICPYGVWIKKEVPFSYFVYYGNCESEPRTPNWNTGGSGGSTSTSIWRATWGGLPSKPAPTPSSIGGAECWPKANRSPDTDCEEQERFKETGSAVDMLLREYTRDHEDISVKVRGGRIAAHRYYVKDAWQWAFERDNLEFEYSSSGEVKDILRLKTRYSGSFADPDLFTLRTEKIRKTETGYRWENKSGSWREYDQEGKLLSYGRRNLTTAIAIYEDDRFVGWADSAGNQVLWYAYTDDKVSSVSDASGRTVEYRYQDGLLAEVIDLRENSTLYSYTDGRISRVELPGGKIRNIVYDPMGNPISVKDELGIGYVFEYDYDKGRKEYYTYSKSSSGKVEEVWFNKEGEVLRTDLNGVTVKKVELDSRSRWKTDAAGHTVKEKLDEWENVIEREYPDGTWVKYSYTQPWNRLVRTDAMGIITEYEYDADGFRTAVINAVGTEVERRTEYTYSDTGKVLTTTLVNAQPGIDAVTRYEYDPDDNLIAVIDPEERVTRMPSYDSAGNPLVVEDSRGYRKYMEYDAAGNLRYVRDHNQELLSEYRYNKAGNRTSAVNALLKEFNFRYDTDGRLLESEDPYQHIQKQEYLPGSGLLSRSIDEEGREVVYEYDSNERLSRVIDGEGNAVEYLYADESGCASCSSGGGGDRVSRIKYPTFSRVFEYDSRGRVVVQKDLLSATEERVIRSSYDEHGNLVAVTDPLGQVTSFTYDVLGRKTSATNALGETTQYEYDAMGNLVLLEDPNKGNTLFAYDLTGRLLKEIRPLLQEISYSYDANGNLTEVIDSNSRKTIHSYDAFNRLTKTEFFAAVSDTEPTKTNSYTYNKLGSLTGYDDGTTSALYSYDDLQRRLSETVDYGTFSLEHSYSYYANSRKKSYTGPGGQTRTWTYDQANRPSGLDLGAAGAITVNSWQWNRPGKITLPGGSTLNYSYNPLQELIDITAKDPGANPVLQYQYAYSKAGQIESKSTEHGAYNYAYDPAYRLVTAEAPDKEESYSYDGLGNRLTSAEHDDWNYNANNQLLAYGQNSYTYDDHGNLTERTVSGVKNLFSYTVDNRLEKVEDELGQEIGSYYYDPYGRRLWKEVGGVRTCFHYNDEGLAGEYDVAGEELRIYGYHAGSPWSTNPLFVTEGGEYYWYQNDHLGTPQKIIAQNGTVAWEARYDAFGEASVLVDEVENNLRFPGQYFDGETGLNYNYQRYYDPHIGRYVTPDPIGLAGGDNLYLYLRGNPVNKFDPFGLAPYVPTYDGWEAYYLIGGGMVTTKCCDDCNKVRKVTYAKFCGGIAVGASYSQGFVSANTNGKSCRNPSKKLYGLELGCETAIGGLEGGVAWDGESVGLSGGLGRGVGPWSIKLIACVYWLVANQLTDESCSY